MSVEKTNHFGPSFDSFISLNRRIRNMHSAIKNAFYLTTSAKRAWTNSFELCGIGFDRYMLYIIASWTDPAWTVQLSYSCIIGFAVKRGGGFPVFQFSIWCRIITAYGSFHLVWAKAMRKEIQIQMISPSLSSVQSQLEYQNSWQRQIDQSNGKLQIKSRSTGYHKLSKPHWFSASSIPVKV